MCLTSMNILKNQCKRVFLRIYVIVENQLNIVYINIPANYIYKIVFGVGLTLTDVYFRNVRSTCNWLFLLKYNFSVAPDDFNRFPSNDPAEKKKGAGPDDELVMRDMVLVFQNWVRREVAFEEHA